MSATRPTSRDQVFSKEMLLQQQICFSGDFSPISTLLSSTFTFKNDARHGALFSMGGAPY